LRINNTLKANITCPHKDVMGWLPHFTLDHQNKFSHKTISYSSKLVHNWDNWWIFPVCEGWDSLKRKKIQQNRD